MPKPCSLCLEDLTTDEPDRRFLRCVALPGRQPGLRLHTDGSVGWRSCDAIACELMVSRDQRLLLFRPDGSPPVEVRRAGRRLLAPHDKPVVLLDEDEVLVASRRFRVHIHGEADVVKPPSYLVGRVVAQGKGVATAMALGAAMMSCNRPAPPEPVPAHVATAEPAASSVGRPSDSGVGGSDSGSTARSSNDAGDARTGASSEAAAASAPPSGAKPPPKGARPRKPPIEVRDMPPFAD